MTHRIEYDLIAYIFVPRIIVWGSCFSALHPAAPPYQAISDKNFPN